MNAYVQRTEELHCIDPNQRELEYPIPNTKSIVNVDLWDWKEEPYTVSGWRKTRSRTSATAEKDLEHWD